MSNSTSSTPTSTSSIPTSTQLSAATSSSTTANPTTSPVVSSTSFSPTTTSTTPVVTSSSTTSPTTTTPTTTSTTPTTTSTTPASTSSVVATTTSSSAQITTTSAASSSINIVTITPSDGSATTITETSTASSPASSTSSSATATSSTGAAFGTTSNNSGNGGLSTGGTIAVAVVVPIVGVALLVLAGLFFWRRRKQRKDAEDLRRKEVEEYGYNPNNDPTLPAVVGASASDGPFSEMREDDNGYRGWGATTVAGTSARNPSTTLSNNGGPAMSEGTSPTHGPMSDTQSTNPLLGANGRPLSGGSEVLGVLGPAAAENRNGINRGPSNASSSYSAANHSDTSGEQGVPGGAYGQAQYYSDNNYSGYGNAYGSSPTGAAEIGGQPIIRDNLARRATRIENPSHFPQPSAGISQNF